MRWTSHPCQPRTGPPFPLDPNTSPDTTSRLTRNPCSLPHHQLEDSFLHPTSPHRTHHRPPAHRSNSPYPLPNGPLPPQHLPLHCPGHPNTVPGPAETSSPLPKRTKRISWGPDQTTQQISPIYPANHKAPSLDIITSPTIHSKHNLAVITIDTISPLPLTPTGGAGDRTGLVGRRAPIEQLQEATPMMIGTPKANIATLKALSEPSTQHSFGVAPPALASLEASATTGLESNTQELFTYTPSFDHDRSYSPGPCKPTCHDNGPEKWTITTRTQYVVLGDAHISKFPSHSNLDLQLDSYPYANFRHFHKLFKRTAPTPPLQPSSSQLALMTGSRTPRTPANN
ncbi:uncharacterized protein LOC119493262 [Sebastes umbrosus]|uniref:uncharacterized protein LOC119493262 n=1 Tax=Sebastes umbrosus TaxID=72105 RepID=UPI00189D9C00|nr:uncharacterized protein LOC119493262 [Sebastes umbrosus]